jgi:hypothetical protein
MIGRVHDDASRALLARGAGTLASIDGPVDSGTAFSAVSAIASVIRARRKPITDKTKAAILTLIQAVREDIMS